jgi:SAM-dependent methyltransferase
MLRCPTCRTGELALPPELENEEQVDEGELRCRQCGSSYPIRFGSPTLLPHGELYTEDWQVWKAHLEKFQARREDRIAHPERVAARWGTRSKPNKPFAEFIDIREGKVLDIGCGPGKFRFALDAVTVEYFGLDPVALPEASDFRLVRGLAEYFPFADGEFTDVVVLAALDHFRDPARFFLEAQRVLRPDGRLHILQSVHDARGPVSLVRLLAHKVKDALEDRATAA